jgi:hypothetical protein
MIQGLVSEWFELVAPGQNSQLQGTGKFGIAFRSPSKTSLWQKDHPSPFKRGH